MNPQRYIGLARGRHTFDVRAVSPAGTEDQTPAHTSWIVDASPQAVTLTSPGGDGTTSNDQPPPSTGSTSSATGALSAGATVAAASSSSSLPSSYSIGGTVSGLSGTVVLRDNGGDDLSVSSNGAFTFAGQLGDGSAYKVTVASNPSGQDCSVSGGTGTVASADVSSVAVTCRTAATDDFNRADGGLGAAWAAVADGGLSIVSGHVAGTPGAIAGDTRIGESYGSDQYS